MEKPDKLVTLEPNDERSVGCAVGPVEPPKHVGVLSHYFIAPVLLINLRTI